MNKVVLIIILVLIFLASIISAILDYSSFFKISLSNCFTLIVAVVFTYYFNQKKQGNRRFYDSAVKILESIQNIIVNSFISNNFDQSRITELQQNMRIVRNKIDVLKTVQDNLDIKSEIDYIDSNFNSYKSIIDNHLSDYEHLNRCSMELNNLITLLDGKITETIIKIYKLDL